MSLRGWLIGGSLVGHGLLVVALGGIRAPAEMLATAIEVTETVKKEPAPPPPVEEPDPPKPPEPKQMTKAAAKAPDAPPPDVAPPEAASPMANLPDFGLELSGGTGGGNGLAMPNAAAARPPVASAKPVEKTLQKAAPAPKADRCDEPPAKPKLLNLPQPAYTDAARAAGIEGKVRVQLTVDENGKVIDAKALTSLGHGLDEAALTAARGATFEAAVRCGKPSRSTFTIAIRFAAS